MDSVSDLNKDLYCRLLLGNENIIDMKKKVYTQMLYVHELPFLCFLILSETKCETQCFIMFFKKKALALFGISMLLAFDIQFLYTDCDS